MEVKQVGRQAANQNWQFVCQKCSMLTLKSHSRVAHPLHTHTHTHCTHSHTESGRQFNYSSRCGDWKQTLATPPTGLHECQDYLHALCMSVCVCVWWCVWVCVPVIWLSYSRFWWLALSECDASTVDNGPHLGARTANCHSPSAHTLPANATGNCRRHAALHQQQQQHLPIQSVSQFQLLFNRLRHRRLASKWDFSICLTCRCHLSAHETCIYLYTRIYVCNTLIYIRLFSQLSSCLNHPSNLIDEFCFLVMPVYNCVCVCLSVCLSVCAQASDQMIDGCCYCLLNDCQGWQRFVQVLLSSLAQMSSKLTRKREANIVYTVTQLLGYIRFVIASAGRKKVKHITHTHTQRESISMIFVLTRT